MIDFIDTIVTASAGAVLLVVICTIPQARAWNWLPQASLARGLVWRSPLRPRAVLPGRQWSASSLRSRSLPWARSLQHQERCGLRCSRFRCR